MTGVVFCTQCDCPPNRGVDGTATKGRHFPLTNSRVTCCGTAMLSSAVTSEHSCETWASRKFCQHRDRLGSEPCDRVRSRLVTTNAQFVFRLLSPTENTSLIGEGLTGATSDSAAGNGVRRSCASGRWTASPLRTTGCLKKPGSTTLTRFSPWAVGICVRTVLPCESVHRRISFARLGHSRKLLEACGPVGGMTPPMDCTEFSVGTIYLNGRYRMPVKFWSQVNPLKGNDLWRGLGALNTLFK